MQFELNIGREQSGKFATAGDNLLDVSVIRAAVGDRFAWIERTERFGESTSAEPTVYLQIHTNLSKQAIEVLVHDISNSLCQDCISIRWADGTGDLVGPFAHDWPTYDPEYFRCPKSEGIV